eukprot:scaffold4717_cov109-Isochrysis_galbana.AAC.3
MAGGRSYRVRASSPHRSRSHPAMARVTQRCPSKNRPSRPSYPYENSTKGWRGPSPPCWSTEKPRLCQSTTTVHPVTARASQAAASAGMAGGVCSSSTSMRGVQTRRARRSCASWRAALAGA